MAKASAGEEGEEEEGGGGGGRGQGISGCAIFRLFSKIKYFQFLNWQCERFLYLYPRTCAVHVQFYASVQLDEWWFDRDVM